MLKCDFNFCKFSCKFAVYFQNTLTHFNQIFHFYTPENVRKPWNIRLQWVKISFSIVFVIL